MAILESTITRLVIQRKRNKIILILHTAWLVLGISIGLGIVFSISSSAMWHVLAPSVVWGFILFFYLSVPATYSLPFPPAIYAFDKAKNCLTIDSSSTFIIGRHYSRNYPLDEILPLRWRTYPAYAGGVTVVNYQTLVLPRRRARDGKIVEIEIRSFGSGNDRTIVEEINQFLSTT